MLRSCLYDYSDAYVVVKETITVEGDDDDKKEIKKQVISEFYIFGELHLSWSKKFITSEMSMILRIPPITDADPPAQELAVIQTTEATFQINNVKLYVLVVTFSVNDNIKFLENVLQGFKRTVSWNKYRSEITTQRKSNNLDYLIDPTFRNIDRLFVLSFKNGNDDPTRSSLDKYYIPLVEKKDFNALVENKLSFHQPVKNKQEAFEKLIETSRNNDCATGNLLDY